MSQQSPAQEVGVATVLLQRLEQERLPRALDLKAKVDAGGCLDELDIAFLERVFTDTQEIRPFLERHPEYQEVASKMLTLYQEITTRALENEKSA